MYITHPSRVKAELESIDLKITIAIDFQKDSNSELNVINFLSYYFRKFFIIIVLSITMNYADIVKGRLTRVGALTFIQNQSETELRRQLTKEEINLLSSHISPINFVGLIKKVIHYMIL